MPSLESVLLDAAGHRRSPATMPGYHHGRAPRNKGLRYPADPPTIEEIVAVMRPTEASARRHPRPASPARRAEKVTEHVPHLFALARKQVHFRQAQAATGRRGSSPRPGGAGIRRCLTVGPSVRPRIASNAIELPLLRLVTEQRAKTGDDIQAPERGHSRMGSRSMPASMGQSQAGSAAAPWSESSWSPDSWQHRDNMHRVPNHLRHSH